ncbi:MAG TPA: hypothetical protein VGO13_13040 [Solirubrobacterales bacterium]|nr:hypothetical protein [Solirubrobacterales bacterium]
MTGGGFNGDLHLAKNGDYCNAFGIGDELTLQDSVNEGPTTGFTTPTPYSSYQERDANESACQAAGNHWGQEVRNGASGSLCGSGHGSASCGLEHYASIGHGTNDRPWSGVFANPSFVLSANAGVQTFNPTGEFYGGWGFLCPEFEDTSFHGVIEYCFEDWRSSHIASQWTGEHFQECGAGPWSEIVTMFYPGTQYSEEMPGSSNTVVGPLGLAHYEARITPANIANAARTINGNCAGWHLSENAENYVLIGVEQGVEGWDGINKIAGSAENLQLRTDYTPRPPVVSTGAASEVQEVQATINGTINPNGVDTHYYFQYGPTTAYGTNVPAPPGSDAGSSSSLAPEHLTLEGLSPSTTYHYRLVANSEGGTSYGSDQTFTTLADPGASGWSVRAPSTDPNDWQWTFYRGPGGQLTETYYNGTSWQTIEPGGKVASGTTPSVVRLPTANPNGNIWVYYQNSSGHLAVTYYSGTAWAGEDLGVQMAPGSSPSAVRAPTLDPNGRIWVFSNGANGHLNDTYYAGTGWANLDLGVQMAAKTSPSAMRIPSVEPNGFMSVFSDGANGHLDEAYYAGSAWANLDQGVPMFWF